jgi:RNA polymerase sigma factor (sigma-70 family)
MPSGVEQRLRSDRVFERLYRRHVDEVYRYALTVLANRADAEDVTQTAFLNAYRAFQAGQRPARPVNWLIAITHNVCRQRFRDAARRPSEVVLDREFAAESDHEEKGFRNENIRRAFSQLTFSQRSALALRELEGRTYREIAEALGITEAAVETLIFRARRAFREQLEGSLSCSEAERVISRQLDGMLARGEKAGLRAHLRACAECASLARRFRAQRVALRGIAIVPLPQSLASFSAGGSGLASGAALGTGLGIKAAALGTAALVAAGVSTEIVRQSPAGSARAAAIADSSSGRPAPRVGEQNRAKPVSVTAAAEIVPVLARGGGDRVRPGAPAGQQGKARHQRTTSRPTRAAAPLTRPPRVLLEPAAGRPAHPVAGSRRSHDPRPATAHEKRGSNGPDRSGKPAKAGNHAEAPGLKAQHSVKEDKPAPSNARAASVVRSPTDLPTPEAGNASKDVLDGPRDPASQASSPHPKPNENAGPKR